MSRSYNKHMHQEEFKRSNRDKRMEAKSSNFWCGYCDCKKVGEYSKCPNCGHRHSKKRLKKPYS